MNYTSYIIFLLLIGVCHGKYFTNKRISFLEYEKIRGLEGRIVGGEFAKIGQIPWQVSLYMKSFEGGYFLCGGSLIDKEWVMTAAHCAQGIESFDLYFGTLHMYEGVKITSKEAYIHELYDIYKLENDVAVIHLPCAIEENENISVISLPKRDEIENDLAGESVQISGWGRTDDEGGSTQYLKYANVTIISNEECENYIPYVAISTVCAVGEKKESICFGDSGGPLAYRRGKEWVHGGIVSFVSSRGCAIGYPSGYVRTVHFLDWISEKTGIVLQ